MAGTAPGLINRKQGLWSILIGAITSLLHLFLQSKGILPPADASFNALTTGTAAAGTAAVINMETDSSISK